MDKAIGFHLSYLDSIPVNYWLRNEVCTWPTLLHCYSSRPTLHVVISTLVWVSEGKDAIEPVGGYTTGQCDARPMVTFPASGRYQFILLGEQRYIVCEQLAQSRYVKRSGRDSNLRPHGCKSDAVTTTPLT